MPAFGKLQTSRSPRARILLERPWRFHLGHATDPQRDFGHSTAYFSYLAKTGYGDGPASSHFDDRAWREVRLPHDWAVEVPFHPKASHSHGYRALGPGFPENSVGWYRHHFEVPQSDLGRRISVEFDGIQRAARVFVNGFFVGEETQGTLSPSYDLTPYLNYGGSNVLAIRADVSLEQGWYYEGAGINRPAYLVKTHPIHVARHGTFVSSTLQGSAALLRIATTVVDERESSPTERQPEQTITQQHVVVSPAGQLVAQTAPRAFSSLAGSHHSGDETLELQQPKLWAPDTPHLYTLITRLSDAAGVLLDEYQTVFGVRSLRYDPNEGFFLNGKSVKLKGSNNHEDHAGVGTATPDSLIEYRLSRLKEMGMNAYRASHAPAAPALLDIADRIGMLVINENRLMGVNAFHENAVKHMLLRDRNHPSIIMWSLGNEEWAIEGNEKGARIAKTMQDRAKRWDPTRPSMVAVSGGWGGISTVSEVMGVNYIQHGDTDQQHAKYPWQIIVGSEETTTQQTRGIYYEDKARGHLPPLKDGSSGGNVESGWKHYAERPYLAGVFYWTGFDYRGEPTPYAFPAHSSQFGILDTCGFPKDSYYYLRSWWSTEPVLRIARHWNWPEREGETMDVTVYGNVEEVELFQDGKPLGKQRMPRNGHLSWSVRYTAGLLRAQGYVAGRPTLVHEVATTGQAASIALEPHVTELGQHSSDVAVVNVSVLDEQGRVVPTAEDELRFSLQGPGRIIGVGNGNPSSLEPDVAVETLRRETLGSWDAPEPNDAQANIVFEARFPLPTLTKGERFRSLLLSALGESQSVTLNGTPLYRDANARESHVEIAFDRLPLQRFGNVLRIEARPFSTSHERSLLDRVVPASLVIQRPAEGYRRRVFNGWAQVLVQAGDDQGRLTLTAEAAGLKSASTQLEVR